MSSGTADRFTDRGADNNGTARLFNVDASERASREIAQLIPGGVNSPFRSFEEVGGHTIFFSRAEGAYLTDIDGNRYIDYLGAWGPAVLGHSPSNVVAACKRAIEDGAVFGTPHIYEMEMARLLVEAYPSIDMVRFVNSGTEAVMSAIRLARGYTGRDIVVMFEGCYHGHSDATLASDGHRASSGIPECTAKKTVLAEFNNLESLDKCLNKHRNRVAAVIVEPVAGSMGVIPPEPGFLEGVQKLTREHTALFVFDEVLTGLRVARGGAQRLFGITPDLTCFGKALGGGMPIGAYGGRREIMEQLQPLGQVYQAGTFSGNPVTMAGGTAILNELKNDEHYRRMEALTARLFSGIQRYIDERSLPVQLQRVGAMFAIIFADRAIKNYKDSLSINADQFSSFFHHILARGINMPPSSVDAACVSSAHTEEDIDQTVEILTDALKAVFA